MKRNSKKLLMLALAALLVGSGIGAVTTYDRSAENVALAEESEVTTYDFSTTAVAASEWASTGDFSDTALYRIKFEPTNATNWGKNVCLNELGYANVFKCILINGKSLADIRTEYGEQVAAGTASVITSSQPNIKSDVEGGNAKYAPIFVNLTNHGANYGNCIDIYIPTNFMAADDIESVTITDDFRWENSEGVFTVSQTITFKTSSWGTTVKYVEGEKTDTTVSNLKAMSATENWIYYTLSESDYASAGSMQGANQDILAGTNLYDNILIDDVTLANILKTNDRKYPGEAEYFGLCANALAIRALKPTSSIEKITIKKGAEFPSYDYLVNGGKVKYYVTTEDVTFVRTGDVAFTNEKYLIKASEITISDAIVTGDEGELFGVDITYANWNGTRNLYDYNYGGQEFVEMRKHIFINGKSLYEINTTVDDSSYVYSTFPWTQNNEIFSNPTLVTGTGNKLTVFIHKDYVHSLLTGETGTISVTVAKGFVHEQNQEYCVFEDATAVVYKKPVTITLNNTGAEPKKVDGKFGDSVTLETPSVTGKTFEKWVDANGETVSSELTLKDDMTLTAVWSITPYTMTVVNGETTETIKFGVELDEENGITKTLSDLAAILAQKLPETTESAVYVWDIAVPETFECKNYTFTVVELPVLDVNATYKFSLYQATLEKTLYLNGAMSGYYMATTEDAAEAIDIYVELSNGGYKFYMNFDNTKFYITMISSGKYVNMNYSDKDGVAFRYDATKKCWYTNVNGTDYYPGTYTKSDGTAYSTVSASMTSYITDSNLGITQFPLELQKLYVLTVVNGAESETSTLLNDATITLSDPAAVDGKTFLGWKIKDAEGVYADVPTTMPESDLTVYAVWSITPYTVTIVNGETTETIKFGVELDEENGITATTETIGAAIAAKLPEDTSEYTYAWSETLPETFELEDYTFTVITTPVESDSGTHSESSSSSSNVTDSSSVSSSDGASTSGDDDKKTFNCFGSVSGALGGIVALGAAASVMLKKKKEENE